MCILKALDDVFEIKSVNLYDDFANIKYFDGENTLELTISCKGDKNGNI